MKTALAGGQPARRGAECHSALTLTATSNHTHHRPTPNPKSSIPHPLHLELQIPSRGLFTPIPGFAITCV